MCFISTALANTDIPTENKTPLFVDVKTAISTVHYDIRYASKNNFVGDVVDGYFAEKCYVNYQLIDSLKRINTALLNDDYRLTFFDCYRPEKAVAHFMRWAKDLNDTQTKAQYYPNVAKSHLAGPYIAEKSGHSKGFTVDITLQKKDKFGNWHDLDMGSSYDLFDTLSHSNNKKISVQQRSNRYLLQQTMKAYGYTPYAMEWWHFTYTVTPKVQRNESYNFDVK